MKGMTDAQRSEAGEGRRGGRGGGRAGGKERGGRKEGREEVKGEGGGWVGTVHVAEYITIAPLVSINLTFGFMRL